jgi:hypothetical protein
MHESIVAWSKPCSPQPLPISKQGIGVMHMSIQKLCSSATILKSRHCQLGQGMHNLHKQSCCQRMHSLCKYDDAHV